MAAHIRWTVPDARSVLEARGFNVLAVEPTKDGFGTVLRCGNGAVVAVYNTGRVLCQGRHIAEAKALFAPTATAIGSPPQPPRAIAAPLAPAPAAKPPAPIPTPASGAVRFVRDIPGPGGSEGVDLPW